MGTGRPLKYKTVEDLEEAIESFFSENNESPTITGLALHLGFDSRKTFYNYSEREEFLHAIKRARTKIEQAHEKRLFEQTCTGSIFYLKNVGWNAEENIVQETTQKNIDMNKLSDEELDKLIAIIEKSES